MSLNSIGTLGGLWPSQADTHARGVQQGRTPATAAPNPALRPQQAAPLASRQNAGSVPAEPPEGTDPELWAVLTSDERAFFAKAGAMGPLTYGYILSSGSDKPPASRGGRIDVKV